MERVKYPWWVTPGYALGGVVFAVVALGGPGAILSGAFTHHVGLAAASSLIAGVLAMVVLEWWSRRIVPPTGLHAVHKRGRLRLGVVAVLIVVGITALQTASESQSGVLRAIVFGLFGGIALGFAVVAPFDERPGPPLPAPKH
jgi:MFS family permease